MNGNALSFPRQRSPLHAPGYHMPGSILAIVRMNINDLLGWAPIKAPGISIKTGQYNKVNPVGL